MVIEKEKDSITVRLDEGKHFLLVEERFVLLCVPHSTFIHISCGFGGVICIERLLQEKETLRRLRKPDR